MLSPRKGDFRGFGVVCMSYAKFAETSKHAWFKAITDSNSLGGVCTRLQGRLLPIGDQTLSQRLRGVRYHLGQKMGWVSPVGSSQRARNTALA
jgi:hypothetical protein